MKRKLLIVLIVLAGILSTGLLILYLGIEFGVKQNIRLTQQKYPGKADDALIAYMMDESISPEGRTHEAIEKGSLFSYARLNR